MAPTLSEALFPKNHPFPCPGDCGGQTVKFNGRHYITGGHNGFNTPANNRDGYATKAGALAAHYRCHGAKPGSLAEDTKTAADVAVENALFLEA